MGDVFYERRLQMAATVFAGLVRNTEPDLVGVRSPDVETRMTALELVARDAAMVVAILEREIDDAARRR